MTAARNNPTCSVKSVYYKIGMLDSNNYAIVSAMSLNAP